MARYCCYIQPLKVNLCKFLELFGLIAFFISCGNVDTTSNSLSDTSPKSFDKQQKIISSQPTKEKRLGDFMSDTTDYFWLANQSQEGSYWIRVAFQEEFAVYQFHGQCLYWFFTNHYCTGTDKIELLWSYKTDCILSMDFLRKSNGVKKYPKFGDAFCEYSLVNDSVIQVKYNFPEWTEKVNKLAKDSIFPRYLYYKNEASNTIL